MPTTYSVQTILDMANGARPITDREARDIERRLGLPNGWMDRKNANHAARLDRTRSTKRRHGITD
jgi:hypothetical protein